MLASAGVYEGSAGTDRRLCLLSAIRARARGGTR
jgi:hypothetical protein